MRVDGFLNLGSTRKLTSRRPSRAAPLPTLIFCEGFELEHACRDLKDGDMQIVRLTWV